MLKKMIALPFILFLTITLAQSCDTTEPPDDDLKPGRRDYTWEVDTLDIYAPISKIWGSSPNDVWFISQEGFWHFDGSAWRTDGISRPIAPHALWGFSQNDVYAGGSSGNIWKFDGNDWKEFAKLKKDGTDFIAFENIWGTNSNDFYAVGAGPDEELYANHSVIAHFVDNNWQIFDTDILKGNVVHFYINKPDQKKYCGLIKIGGIVHPDSTIIYEYNNGNYKKLYSSLETKGKQADLSIIDKKVYFILGNKIATRLNDQFKTVITVDNANFYQRIWGRSSHDIFLLMTDGLAHYNGTNIEYFFFFNKTPQTQIYGAALFEKEVFFIVYEGSTGLKYIYHGVLK